MATKLMAIRRPDFCAGCALPLPPKTRAWWDSTGRTVTCVACQDSSPSPVPAAPRPLPPPQPIDAGIGGISAQQEYEKRAANHRRVQDAAFGTGVLGGVTAAPDYEPNHVAAWAKGAEGERRLAAHLDSKLSGAAVALHDRKVPGTKGNIDHLVIAPSGVWVIDAKNYKGRVQQRVVGARRNPEARLYVARQNCTKLVGAMAWQADAVRRALEPIGFGAVPIHRCICFTNAEWSLLAKPIVIEDVWIGWGGALTKQIKRTSVLRPDAMATIAHHLSQQLRASG